MSVLTSNRGDTDRAVSLTVALAVLGVFITYVPITAVAVALTSIGSANGASTVDMQWISDFYIIPMAAMVLSAGVFGDIYGRRLIFLVGMALTVLGSGISALAATQGGLTGIHILWCGQAVTGFGAGLLLPTTLALIAHAVPDPRKRGPYIALWATGLVMGLALGPLISGGILEADAGWGWIFVPIAGLAALGGVVGGLLLPESKSPQGRHLDWPGQISASIAIAASIFGVIKGGESGWASAGAVTGLVIAAAAAAVFVVTEMRVPSPLVQLSIFRSLNFTVAGLAALVALFSIVGSTFVLSLFMGRVQQLSALDIGLRLLFVTGVCALVNPLVGIVMHRFAPTVLLAAGLGLAAVSMVLLSGVDAGTGLVDLGWRLAIFGVAVAMMLSTVSVAAINSVPFQLAGMASATNTALRQFGGALGPAVLGVVFGSQIDSGATPVSALHTSLLVIAAILAAATVACVIAWLVTRHKQSSPEVHRPMDPATVMVDVQTV